MKKETLIVLIILVASLFRLVPHPPNFAPITAMALFSGTMLPKKIYSLLIPIMAMLISDLFIGFYSISIWVYFAFGLVTMFGWFVKDIKWHSAFISSVIFFIVTNLGAWWLGYPHTIVGLTECFILAIPFFGYSLVGDLFWTYAIKLSYSQLEQRLVKIW